MMFCGWSLRFLGTAVFFSFGLLPISAQSRGYSPDRLQQLDQIGPSAQMLAKGLRREAVSAYVSTEADYLDPAFWNGPPFNDSSVSFTWPKSWKAEDRQGDTRLKYNWLRAEWNPQHDGTGTDHFYLRFDLKRVVTSATEFTRQGQGHLGDALYTKMTGDGLLSDKTKIRIMMSVAYAKPDYMSGLVPVHLHDLTYDMVIVDINGTPLNILIPGLQYGDHVLPIDFTVPTSALRFPTKGDPEPTPAWNVVHFKLVPPKVRSPYFYTIGGYVDIPATFIQYSFTMDAELTFGAMAPVFLVHGTNAGPSTWDVPDKPGMDNFGLRSFNYYFFNSGMFNGICFSDITLTANGTIENNSSQLSTQITQRLLSAGAKACHIIAHSKGGLDSRGFIDDHYGKDHLNEHLEQPKHFEVLSLYTLDTPHRGTVLSDIAWNKRNWPLAKVQAAGDWVDMQNLMDWDLLLFHMRLTPDGGTMGTPAASALDAQRTEKMGKWNATPTHPSPSTRANVGGPLRFYNTASDADWNIRNGSIDATEREDSGYPGGPLAFLATSAYRMLYYAKQVTVVGWRGGALDVPVVTLNVPIGQGGREWNDLVVSIGSACYDGGTLFPSDLGTLPPAPGLSQEINGYLKANHSSLKNMSLAQLIVYQIGQDWPVKSP